MRPAILVLGPHRDALSGVSTHLRILLASRLAQEYQLLHFQVGSEGRQESRLQRTLRFIRSPLALGVTILLRGVRVVHVNTSLNARAFWRDFAYMLIAKLCGARVLCQVHGGALPQEFCGGRGWLGALLRCALRLPDRIALLARTELDAYRRFVPGQAVALVPNGIDCLPYAGAARAAPDTGTPLRLVYLGRLVREKGVFELLEAIRLARADGSRLRLVIAGDGPEAAALQQFAENLGVAHLVTFAASVSGERKVQLLAQSDVLVLVSYAEGMPYVLLEAMAAGAAVIATRTGAIPDVALDGVHGLLVAARSPHAIRRAIARLEADRGLLQRMSAACRERIAGNFSTDRLAASLDGIYSKLCANAPEKHHVRNRGLDRAGG